MADNVTLPATGTGTASVVQATDDVSGVHYPKVKLIDSTADSTTPVGVAGNGAATNALRVTIANDSTGIVALTTSTASIGKLAANDGVDIGNVDVASVSGTVTITGSVAHGASDSGNPVKSGAKSIADVAGATMVTAGQRTDVYAGIDGVLLTRPYTSISNTIVERLSDATGNATNSTAFGATASAKNCITTIAVYNSSTTTSGYIDFLDGSTPGTIIFTLPLPAGGGAVCNFPVPLVQPTANNALRFDVSTAITTVYISLIGFKSKA